ncbi:MAG: alkaline phosphatase [Ruminococcaceae bacterium]|nr:alkaline phosphatase [Oscillospiraceae bacterium]
MAIFQKVFAVIIAALTSFATMIGHFGLEAKPEEYKTYKNVIIMIGDGMGFNHLEATKQAYDLDELNMEDVIVKAESKTNSLFGVTTDSAAGGTALSSGIRTINGMVGTYAFDPFRVFSTPKNVTEVAIEQGKATGVVTTDYTSGATPSSFSAHTYSRDNDVDITEQQLASDIDLIWGAYNGLATSDVVSAAGRTYIGTATELAAFDGETKSFAQFSFDDLKYVANNYDTPTLEVMTEKAIDVLSADEDGFFLMVEGACIDKHSHSNDLENMILSTYEFDKAVGAALEFAEEDGETLVIVTADHETGGLKYDAEKDEYYFTSGSHTNVNVPLYMNKNDAGFVNGAAYQNRHVSAQVGLVLGADKDSYPCAK